MYKDYSFSGKDIETYEGLIPEYYREPLRKGELGGIVVMDDDGDSSFVVGIVLYKVTLGYFEIVWVATTEEYDLPDYGADIVRRMLNKVRVHGGFMGIFARFRKGSPMEEYFPEDEFDRTTEVGGVYRFRLKDVDKFAEEHDSKRALHCVALGSVDGEMKNTILAHSAEAHDFIPLAQPVNWESYDQELSFIFQVNDDPKGIILVEKVDDELVLRLLYSKDPVAAIVLLKHSFHMAYDRYGEDCQVVCPVVRDISAGLIRKIVRNPQHVDLIKVQADIPIGSGTMLDFAHYR